MKALILDTETTGLDNKRDFITSIAWNIVDTETNDALLDETYYSLINYGKPNVFGIKPTEIASSVNKIGEQEIIENGRAPHEVFEDLYKALKQSNIIGAWFLPFDSNMLNGVLRRLMSKEPEHSELYWNIIRELNDTMHLDLKTLDSMLFPLTEDLHRNKHNLSIATERMGIKDPTIDQDHNAGHDVELTVEAFKYLAPLMYVYFMDYDAKTEMVLGNIHELIMKKYDNHLSYKPNYL